MSESQTEVQSKQRDRNSPEAIKERLGAAYFLQVILQEEEVEEQKRKEEESKNPQGR